MIRKIIVIAVLFLFPFGVVLIIGVSQALAADVTLAWDANDPTPDGYNIYQRQAGQEYNYTHPVWSGAATVAPIGNLELSTNYYFVVRAFVEDVESADSNEVTYATPDGPTNPKGVLAYGTYRLTIERLQPDGTWQEVTFTIPEPDPEPEYPYRGNSNTKKFHKSTCRYADSADVGFDSREEAIAAGYEPCGVCKP